MAKKDSYFIQGGIARDHLKDSWHSTSYSDLDSADFQNLKFIAKLSTDVATSALLNKIVIEVNYRRRSLEVNQSAIDVNAIF